MAIASEDSAQRAADSASSGEDESEDDKEESEDVEEEEEELGEEADNSSESGTDESEVGRASSSGGSDNEGESEDDEDDDVSDTDQEEEPERVAEGDAKATVPGITRSVFLKTTTAKSGTQPGERTDCKVPSKFPQKPMIELQVNSNIWYQAYVFKESANEVKVRFPGFGRAKTDKIEWLRKSSCRIWTGSYKASDWKHLGKGAWEPRSKAAGSRQQARSGSVGPVGSAGRAKGQLKRFRDENTASATPELTSQAGDASEDDLHGKHCGDHSPTSKGKGAQGRKGRLGEDHEGLGHAATARRKSKQPSRAGLEEEVVSPRPSHVSTMRGPADKGVPQLLQVQRQLGGSQQRSGQQQQHPPRREEQMERRQQQQPGDEHHSEGEHYWSAHSPNVAESPGVFADQNSSRSSLDQAGGNNQQVHDPDHDPLRKWFEAHFQKLHAAGKLSSLPFGMCESGVLPDGFVLDSSVGVVAAAAGCSKAEASHSAAVKPGPEAPAKSAPGSTPAAVPGPKVSRGPDSYQHKKKRPREAGLDQRNSSGADDGKVDGVKRPVKLMVKQVPPQPVVPGPAASVEELPAPVSDFWRDTALGPGPGLLGSPRVKESKEGKGCSKASQQQQQQQQHGPLHGKQVQACAASAGPAAAVTATPAGAAASAAPAAPAVAAAPTVPAAREVPPPAAGSDDAGAAGVHKAPAFALPHKAVSKHASKDRLGRRVVLSESDEDEDQVSPRPAAAAAPAPAAPAPAAAPAQPASISAPPSASVPAAAAGKINAGPAHAGHGSAHPAGTPAAAGSSAGGTASAREEPGGGGKRPAPVTVGASKDSASGSAPALTVAVPVASVGHRGQALEASRVGGAAELHGKGAAGSEGGGARVSETGGAAADGSRARGPAPVGPGLSRPSSPVGSAPGLKLGQQQGSGPSRSTVSEPDRSKAAPVLATDDIDF